MNLIQSLSDLHDLLMPRENWTQGSSARDANNNQVSPHSPVACKWCLTGAIEKVTHNNLNTVESNERARYIIHKALTGGDGADVVMFNDSTGTTHGMVLALIGKAIDNYQTTA